jgi:hypothetical protein
LEATSSPCPFTGIPGHTNAVSTSRFVEDATYKNTDFHGILRSFDSVRAEYGNEIINGQGSRSSWADRLTQPMGLPVPANSTTIPADPRVIARSAIKVQLPFFDETLNAPIFDTGPNSVWDDFDTDLIVPASAMGINPDYSANPALAPYATIPGGWAFWGRYMEHADNQATYKDSNNVARYATSGYTGFQIFQRHGRLYTTFGDAGQDIGGTMGFSSLKSLPLALSNTKYAHSFFRVNSDASHRRYWHWSICGAGTRAELVDSSGAPKIRPIVNETAFSPGGDNPTAKLGDKQVAATPKECLSIIQEGRAEAARSDGGVRSSSRIAAEIHPAGVAKGIIALGNNATDKPVASGPSTLGFRYKIDAAGKYAGPVMGTFDQTSPLTHLDVFLRRDRLVVFVNGRQGFCVDLSSRPLTMNYGLVAYGDLIYHSALEWQEVSNDSRPLYHHTLNAPQTSSRVWDAVGETEQIDIPSQFDTFDPSLCQKPANMNVQ